MQYPAHFELSEEGGFVVTFRDIPEALTQGDSEEETRVMAADALEASMDFYFEDKRAIPEPSAVLDGERLIELPADLSARIVHHNESLK